MNNNVEPYRAKSNSHIMEKIKPISKRLTYHSDSNINYYEDEIEDEIEEIKSNISRNVNLSPELGKLLNKECMIHNTEKWEPPENSGLNNCNIIIPNYYVKTYDQIIDIEYITIIKDDIKNFRPLNFYQLEYIKSIPNEEKNKLFDIFNDCIKTLNELIIND
jgi:hypothetical protein